MRKPRLPSDVVLWGIFFLVGGLVLLFNNLGLFGDWGTLLWSGLYAVAGLAFLIVFALHRRQWWPIIPAFTLLGLAGVAFLRGRALVTEPLQQVIFLASMGLGFWIVFLLDRANWWAIIPGGVIWVLALVGFAGAKWALESNVQNGILFIGLGAVFAILYLVRNVQRPLGWAAIPAASLVIFGGIILTSGRKDIVRLWPLLLVAIGLALLLGQWRGAGAVTVTLSAQDKKAPAPAIPVSDLPPAKVPTTSAIGDETTKPPKPEKPSGGQPS